MYLAESVQVTVGVAAIEAGDVASACVASGLKTACTVNAADVESALELGVVDTGRLQAESAKHMPSKMGAAYFGFMDC